MRIPLALLIVGTFGASDAHAQGTTAADGVQALVRGDYQAAMRILRPLAEKSPTPDPTAQFFLATLYESGNGGGAPNMMRACNLYLAASRPENPLSGQSRLLAQAIMDQLRGLGTTFCTGEDWQAVAPTTFTLGPDHRVRIDEAGTVVSYKGTQRVARSLNGGPGFRYPPVQYVPLDVTAPTSTRRHFIEFFAWVPLRSSGQVTWKLGWTLSEVVEADLVFITGDPALLTVVSPQPPDQLDLSTVVRVGLNADGEAEWAILSGPKQRGAVIPPRRGR